MWTRQYLLKWPGMASTLFKKVNLDGRPKEASPKLLLFLLVLRCVWEKDGTVICKSMSSGQSLRTDRWRLPPAPGLDCYDLREEEGASHDVLRSTLELETFSVYIVCPPELSTVSSFPARIQAVRVASRLSLSAAVALPRLPSSQRTQPTSKSRQRRVKVLNGTRERLALAILFFVRQ